MYSIKSSCIRYTVNLRPPRICRGSWCGLHTHLFASSNPASRLFPPLIFSVFRPECFSAHYRLSIGIEIEGGVGIRVGLRMDFFVHTLSRVWSGCLGRTWRRTVYAWAEGEVMQPRNSRVYGSVPLVHSRCTPMKELQPPQERLSRHQLSRSSIIQRRPGTRGAHSRGQCFTT